MKKFAVLFLISFLSVNQVFAAHEYSETYYQTQWCSMWHGDMEYALDDKTRIDCVTKNYAVEFDFAPKWAEALGQALHYGYKTGKKAAIILILESKKDFKYYNRLKPLCKLCNVTLWYMKSPLYDGIKR